MSGERLGQHFLNDQKVVERIVNTVFECNQTTIVEVGAGRGVLTEALIKKVHNEDIVAIEFDSKLAQYITKRFSSNKQVSVVETDARFVKLNELPFSTKMQTSGYIMTGNLPYYAALPIMRNFIEFKKPPNHLVCMLQEEVADTLCASTGARSFISVVMQTYGKVTKQFSIAPESFRPPPNVNSAIIKIDLYASPLVDERHLRPFFEFTKRCFTSSRKQLVNCISNGLALSKKDTLALLEQSDVSATQRPQELEIEQFKKLYFAWRKYKSEQSVAINN